MLFKVLGSVQFNFSMFFYLIQSCLLNSVRVSTADPPQVFLFLTWHAVSDWILACFVGLNEEHEWLRAFGHLNSKVWFGHLSYIFSWSLNQATIGISSLVVCSKRSQMQIAACNYRCYVQQSHTFQCESCDFCCNPKLPFIFNLFSYGAKYE